MLYNKEMLDIKTHKAINQYLCGMPLSIVDKSQATVELKTTNEMVADEKGLIHGGFIFSLADYAAMLSVNEENVVLGSSNVKFLKPVKVGDELLAKAFVEKVEGKKYFVRVDVFRNDEKVFEGEFLCIVPSKHVLEV